MPLFSASVMFWSQNGDDPTHNTLPWLWEEPDAKTAANHAVAALLREHPQDDDSNVRIGEITSEQDLSFGESSYEVGFTHHAEWGTQYVTLHVTRVRFGT